jgi:hypothetical protein
MSIKQKVIPNILTNDRNLINIQYDASTQSKYKNNYELMSPNNDIFRNESTLKIDSVSKKIYDYFKIKYPETMYASGLKIDTIKTIVIASLKKYNSLDQSIISKIITVIDSKIKNAIYSENIKNKQNDTTTFVMDNDSKITMEKFLENFTNKVTILNNSDKAIENNLPNTMAPINDIVDIKSKDPFNEDFPIRDREKQTDLMVPEVRRFDYYLAIDSKDRDIDKFPDPNGFIIELAPAPQQNTNPNRGYIDRAFGNIESCELLNVIIRDTSDQSDSSDAGGIQFPYLLLQFEELQQNYFGTNNNLTRTFAILTEYNKPTGSNYKYYNMVGDRADSSVIKIYNPRINLNKITTKLLLPDGSLFNFGSNFTNDTSNTVISVSFRISTVQRNLATQYLDKATH